MVFGDAVVVFPLEESDPDDDGGEFVGVELGLDAVELLGRRHFVDGIGDGELDVVLDGKVAGLFPEVEQAAESDVEEVSRAAGGVEDADGGERVEKGGEEAFGFGIGGEEGVGGSFGGGGNGQRQGRRQIRRFWLRQNDGLKE